MIRSTTNKGGPGNNSAPIDINAVHTTNFRSTSAMRGAEFHGNTRCRMSGVPSGRECSGTSRGSSAHAGISEMGNSGVRPCRENGNYLKWVANYRYIPIYSTVTIVWIPTTLRYSPLLPVSEGLTAKIADAPKFSEHSRPGGTPETRHPS